MTSVQVHPKIPGLEIPIRTIFCIGRNYAEHAKELGNAVPDEPVVFLKPVSAVCYSGQNILIPQQSQDVHHEVEVVVAIGDTAKNISDKQARSLIAGYGIGIDVTARDLQAEAKKKMLPWAISKGFDTFAPISTFLRPDQIKNPNAISFSLDVNDKPRQVGNTKDMIFGIEELICRLSKTFTLARGDLIFTGTPKGVMRLIKGDKLTARLIDDDVSLELMVDQG